MTLTANPAHNLVGLTLEKVWLVIEKISKDPNSTGGFFSVCYKVRNIETDKQCFLKAIDFSTALGAVDPARALQSLTQAYNFERDLLLKCGDAKMKRVTLAVSDGVCQVPGSIGPLSQVHYLIFEMGEADIRVVKSRLDAFDAAWILRSLHHAAVGVKELHSKGIIHQDIKPSNIMQFSPKSFKVSDLGRAWDANMDAPHDLSQIPGDRSYAPPEAYYGLTSTPNSRKMYDLYSLGGLIFFHFLHTSPTILLMEELQTSGLPTTSDYNSDLPALASVFNLCLNNLKGEIKKMIPQFADEITNIAGELCNPNMELRGHPDDRAMVSGDKYSVERYISRFDYMAKRLETQFS